MAQPLFDDHPLQQYLRGLTISYVLLQFYLGMRFTAAGEPPEVMPGSTPEFLQDLDEFEPDLDDEPEWRPDLLVRVLEVRS
jgi:hypothetical protein